MRISSASTAARAGSNERSAAARRAGAPRLRAELARPPRLGAAPALRRLRRLAARLHLGALCGRSRAWRAVPCPHVPAQFRALAAPLRRDRRKPADCRDRDLFRHPPVAPGRPSRVAQPDAALDHLAGPRLHRALPLVPSDHRRDPVREGARLRRARRHHGSHRRLDRLHLEAVRRGHRGDLPEAGRSRAGDRRRLHERSHHGRAAAGAAAFHRLCDLPARLQSPKLHHGRHRRRRRHRRDPVHRLSALRLRFRARDPDRHRGADHGGRDRVGLGEARVPVSVAARVERDWRRFTPVQRLARYAFSVATAAAVVLSLRTVEVIPEFLYDARAQMGDLFGRMWPMDWRYFGPTWDALVETLHIATLGTILALLMAVPIGVLAARNVTPNPALNLFAEFIFVTSRSVNSLVWALLFVAVFGPGPLAGTLAIAFRSIGFTGKLLAEALEEANRGAIEALTAAGAPKLSTIVLGYWPQARPAFWSIALFRWDINIRESAVLGLDGAGGIGVALDTALNLLYWDRVAVVLATIFAIVILTEMAVTFIRARVI